MGRPKKDEQIPLMDVDPPAMKTILKNARAYLSQHEACGEENEKAKKLMVKLRESIEESGAKPLEGGVYRIKCDDKIFEVIPQTAKVKIKNAKKDEPAADDAEE